MALHSCVWRGVRLTKPYSLLQTYNEQNPYLKILGLLNFLNSYPIQRKEIVLIVWKFIYRETSLSVCHTNFQFYIFLLAFGRHWLNGPCGRQTSLYPWMVCILDCNKVGNVSKYFFDILKMKL